MKRLSTLALLVGFVSTMSLGCATNSKKASMVKSDGASSGGCPHAGKQVESASFGEKMKLSGSQPVHVDLVMSNPNAYEGKLIRVAGNVATVCAKKGCWLRLGGKDSDGETLFVKFTCPVDGRLIPMAAVGKEALVEGILEIKEISEADARHYLEDANASAEEIAKVVGPQKQLKLNAPAAKVVGISSSS